MADSNYIAKPGPKTIETMRAIEGDLWRWGTRGRCRFCDNWSQNGSKLLHYGVRHYACRECVDEFTAKNVAYFPPQDSKRLLADFLAQKRTIEKLVSALNATRGLLAGATSGFGEGETDDKWEADRGKALDKARAALAAVKGRT